MPLDKLKRLFIADDEGGLPQNNVPVVSIEEEETIKALLNPPKKKVVKIAIKTIEDVKKIIPYAQSNDVIIIDLRRFLNKPNELQKIANKIEGIATAANAAVMRVSGCEAHLVMIPDDMEVQKVG